MKAIVFHGIGDIRLDTVKEPKIREDSDAIVRLTASAICGTDLHLIRGTLPGVNFGELDLPVLNSAGRIAFVATLTGPAVTAQVNDRALFAQVDPVGHLWVGRLVGLELGTHARVHEQSLEHDLDVLRLAELALDPCAPAARADDDQISGANVAAAFPVDRDRYVRHEVRLADEQLAALVDLDD